MSTSIAEYWPFSNFFSTNDVVMITVTIKRNSSSLETKLVRLNLTDNLLNIRKKLEKDYGIDDTLLFSKKSFSNNNKNYEFTEIELEKEENARLDDIVN